MTLPDPQQWQNYGPRHYPAPPIQIPARKRRKWPWAFGGVVLLAVVIGSVSGGGEPTTAGVPSATRPSVSPITGGRYEQPAAAPVVEVLPARKISAREWQLIAKDPDAHTGERIIVYGQVTQFDSVTGTEGFRANVDGIEHKPEYGYADYDTNTILHADDASVLADIVQDDLFRAEATVAGTLSYETTLGGTMTAPKLTVTKIQSIGHVD